MSSIESVRRLVILGTRGVPAAHGGFETFAEALALYLVARGWCVTVYCQGEGDGVIVEDHWQGIHRVRIPTSAPGPRGTMQFDWRAISHVLKTPPAPVLTLGYNTAFFNARLKRANRRQIINMDGLEWQRDKWGLLPKLWLWLNERYAARCADVLIADHPEIRRHLLTRAPPEKIVMIPYGADAVASADPALLAPFGVAPDGYGLVIARLEPENSLREIVAGWSARRRGRTLLVVGGHDPQGNAFHRALQELASDEVKFAGAIYTPAVVQALRKYAALYLHGHRVGGTNPSLVEALAAGTPVLAHDNRFNRWVADDAARYFTDADSLSGCLNALLVDDASRMALRHAGRRRHAEAFQWETVLAAYESLLLGPVISTGSRAGMTDPE